MRHEAGIAVWGTPGTRPPRIRHALAVKDGNSESKRVNVSWDGRNRRSHRTTELVFTPSLPPGAHFRKNSREMGACHFLFPRSHDKVETLLLSQQD